jgi:hypothetical protein
MVIVDHGGGWDSGYYHSHRFQVRPGDRVEAGDVLAYPSTYGECGTGPHVHFWIRGPNGETTRHVTLSGRGTAGIAPGEIITNTGNFRPGTRDAAEASCRVTLDDGCLFVGEESGRVYMLQHSTAFLVNDSQRPENLRGARIPAEVVSERFLQSLPKAPADGSLITESGSDRVFIVYGDARFPIPNRNTFDRMGFHWSNVKTIPAGSAAQLPLVPVDKTIFREFGNPQEWYVFGAIKFPVSGAPERESLKAAGLIQGETMIVPAGTLAQIPTAPEDGTLIKETGSDTVSVVYGGAAFRVPDRPTFEEMGFDWSAVQTVPEGTLEKLPSSPPRDMIFREFRSQQEWYLSGGLKYQLSSDTEREALIASGRVPGGTTLVPTGALARTPAAPEDGTLMKEAGADTVFVVYGGARFQVPSRAAFEAMGFDWDHVQTVPAGTTAKLPLTPPRETVLREFRTDQAWYVSGGVKYPVSSERERAAHMASGRFLTDTMTVPAGALSQIPTAPQDGALIKEAGSDTVFVVYGGARFQIPNRTAFDVMGFDWDDVQTVPTASVNRLALSPLREMVVREFRTQQEWYVIGSVKFPISDAMERAALKAYGHFDGETTVIPAGTIAQIPEAALVMDAAKD